MTLSQPPDPETSLANKLAKIKLKDPISLALVLIVGLLALFLLFPSGGGERGQEREAYRERLAERRQRDDRAAEQALDQFQKRLRDQGLVLQDQEAYRALREQNEALLAQNAALRKNPATGESRQPWGREQDSILTQSFYAPLQKRVWQSPDQNLTPPEPTRNPKPHSPAIGRHSGSDSIRPNQQATATMATLQPGTWIAAILDHRVQGQVSQHARATIRQDVIDEAGRYVLIPKGSTALLKVIRGQNGWSNLTMMTLASLIRPDGHRIDLPLAVHGGMGQGGLEPDRVNRHFWQKLGLATLVAVSGAAPYALFDDRETASFQLQVGESTAARLANLIERMIAIPDDITLEGGHPIHILVTEPVRLPPTRSVFESSLEPDRGDLAIKRLHRARSYLRGEDLEEGP